MNLNFFLNTVINRIEKLTETLTLLCRLLTILIRAVKAERRRNPALRERKLWTHMEVIAYLGISLSTYKRRVKEGVLKPMTLTGDDRYFEEDLLEAMEESRLKGKV